MTVARKFRTVIRLIRSRGIPGVIDVALKKIFPSGNYVLSWESRVLFRCPRDRGASLQGGNAERLPAGDAGKLASQYDLSLKAVTAAITRGESCWVARDEGNIVAYAWVSGASEEVESDTAFPIDTGGQPAYWWGSAYVHPEYRGKGLLAEIFKSWRATLEGDAAADVYTEVEPANIRSIKAHSKLGFREVGRLRMICVCGVRVFSFRNNDRTALSFRFYPHNTYYSSPACRTSKSGDHDGRKPSAHADPPGMKGDKCEKEARAPAARPKETS